MKKLVFAILILITLFISFCSSEKTLVRKASNAVESADYDQAIAYYDEVLVKDSNSYYATAGKGIVLSEYKEKHREAIPYLEKALKNSPKKNLTKIYADLGKDRSEERRVGKECRSRWSTDH